MVKHKLTTGQMQKFVKALGGDNADKFVGGEFTTLQLMEQTERITRSLPEDLPEITDDPEVNYAIDCYTSGGDELEYDPEVYAEEIEEFRKIAPFEK